MHTFPIFTDVRIAGLSKQLTVLHITDLHACEISNEDIAVTPDPRLSYLKDRQTAFWGSCHNSPDGVISSACNYANEIGACAIIATGDILDFPSAANFALLEKFASSSVPVFYLMGNHDWTFADTYMSREDQERYLPSFLRLSNMRNGVASLELEDIVFISVDDCADRVTAEAYEAYIKKVAYARHRQKAVVLNIHVPLTSETLAPECIKVWGRNICIGENALGDRDEPTIAFFRAVTEESEFAPDAVISGHLHLSHENIFPNGVHQITTANASGNGIFRVVRFIPA